MGKKSTTATTATTAAAWRKPREEGELVPLPSGNWARLRPADLLKMVRSGSIPDILSPVAAKAIWSEQDPEKIGESFELAKQYDELLAIVLPAVFVEPKVAMADTEPAEDEISMEDIELGDRTAAFNLAIMGASAMRNFREQQEKRMAALSNGNQDSDPA